MSINCTRCQGLGFINIHQLPEQEMDAAEASPDLHAYLLAWIAANQGYDVAVCDCCGDGDTWYGTPGEHYNRDDPDGDRGPYRYNGGLCECN